MKKNGFTLMELLVTLIILGSITVIAIPSFTSVYKTIRKNDLDGKIIDIELNANKLGEKYKDDIKIKKCEKYTIDTLIERGYLISESDKKNEIYNPVDNRPLDGIIYTCYCEPDYKIKSYYTKEFDSKERYYKNEKVVYNDKIYKCINDYPGKELGIDAGYFDKDQNKSITYFEEVDC